ncbi:tRNA (adenosine(37)-N6)-dimethylallyltransferase MiaA [Cupriavidus taiwanensis]|uniref:tRNA dimethylallyltransferase n=1 Tax=Cupriavidus taiwanensis (strain DSM 17343 / BCRC 17206 / CCUG 44338 / CIP 107171 / LMG 19424 / R1) TaxID=977880 RepID=MIAA_CUPTR|nr:tRNA (adenosine(37)-N6)-dimethylallyltransferase MiaA [Cupriavidus taiwanensis]B3R6B8.1 RecName: Full=tRNA dimethylallyltransferase; AltName: Full=Dimethylallyl diphosphate:tRNA dimethylallyltransferase; Short=DMAPP:tRNA dimethylallyltransferase; Short=DMATase; AltName: Full=Isopentenyl-diphosphate:tRNA isopentenyltransferase; Short=IPP transferase; Short=IPPT; Short=IPTase [Cupriavidus taiwanensis LMG 19424]CAQ70476.1 delta(2)-isopentenylpyrophosphate tRNA-adenosine transferase [Cupriavidus t
MSAVPHDSPAHPPVVCLLGPTASGKTAAALALAADAPVEIISLDSALVYREMDIGTAKPTREELAVAPHHLIDIIDPADSYSAAQFVADAERLIGEIHARGHVPLIVGGTMLYYKALTQGLNDLPQADAALRAELDQLAAERGWPALHAMLAEVDPVTAARLAPNDAQRIQRALEIHRLSGQPMSALLARQAEGRTFAGAADQRYRVIALEPSDRLALHHRIARRYDAMLAQGFIDEVERLRARGDLHPGLPSIRCVGYRQVWEYLDGEADFATMRERGIAATRQLCKRQLTWLRSTPERRVVDCLATDYVDQVRRLADFGH